MRGNTRRLLQWCGCRLLQCCSTRIGSTCPLSTWQVSNIIHAVDPVHTGHWPRLPHFDVSQSQYSVAAADTWCDHEINIGGAGGIMERASTQDYFPPCWVAAVGYYARNKRRGRTKVSLSASVHQCWHQCTATFTIVVSLPSKIGTLFEKLSLSAKHSQWMVLLKKIFKYWLSSNVTIGELCCLQSASCIEQHRANDPHTASFIPNDIFISGIFRLPYLLTKY